MKRTIHAAAPIVRRAGRNRTIGYIFVGLPILAALVIILLLAPYLRELNAHLDLQEAGARVDWVKGHIYHVCLQNARITPAVLSSLGACQCIEVLDLSGSDLTDLDVSQLSGLRRLEYVFLYSTKTEGTDLTPLLSHAQLRVLALNGPNIDDQLLSRVAKHWRRLETLFLSGTHVTDAGLQHLGSVQTLRRLTIVDTDISNAGLQRLGAIENLEGLSLEGTDMDDDGLRHLATLSNLVALSLAGNTRVTGVGLGSLANLRSLQSLILSNTAIDDDGIEKLPTLDSLRFVQLQDTLVTGQGVATVSARMPYADIMWSGNLRPIVLPQSSDSMEIRRSQSR